MSFIGGLATQSGRNATFEPWRGNSRSDNAMTRAGEITADSLFAGAGTTIGVLAVGHALHGGGTAGRVGAALIAGIGLTAAALGVTNLLAARPTRPTPDLHPAPTSSTTPAPASPAPTPATPTSDPAVPPPGEPDPSTVPDYVVDVPPHGEPGPPVENGTPRKGMPDLDPGSVVVGSDFVPPAHGEPDPTTPYIPRKGIPNPDPNYQYVIPPHGEPGPPVDQGTPPHKGIPDLDPGSQVVIPPHAEPNPGSG